MGGGGVEEVDSHCGQMDGMDRGGEGLMGEGGIAREVMVEIEGLRWKCEEGCERYRGEGE